MPKTVLATTRYGPDCVVCMGDWQIIAFSELTQIESIGGFKNKSEVDEWMTGEAKLRWLRAQGYAK